MNDPRLNNIRNTIDSLDRRLIELLQERAGLAKEVGRVKRDLGIPIHDPAREANIKEKLAAGADGPMSPDALERIYRVIMAESRRLQEKVDK